jgi:hypothetical protein
MRIMLLLTACIFMSGCSLFRTAKVESKLEPIVEVSSFDCYTVDLFTEIKVEKAEDGVSAENQQFLGEWGGGAWNDVWCHGLLINKIYADGRVDLVDMHAPYVPFAQPATAFRRVGRIDEEGNLRFSHGTSTLSYRIENGKLIGNRSGQYGNLSVELARLNDQVNGAQLAQVPAMNSVLLSKIPTPNPIRMSQLGLVAIGG